jgi:nucleoside 2-deoxyribosyltransferase
MNRVNKDEKWKFTIYLAGYSNNTEYRKIAMEKYGDQIDLIDPMCITWDDVNSNVCKNVSNLWLVKRDKKLIDQCDILVANIEYLPYGEIMIGTLMEIMYAYDHGIPIFLISSENKILNNAWLTAHYKYGFKTIEECFEFILGLPPENKIIMKDGSYVINPMYIDYNDGAGKQLCGGTCFSKEGTCTGHIDNPGPKGVKGSEGLKENKI